MGIAAQSGKLWRAAVGAAALLVLLAACATRPLESEDIRTVAPLGSVALFDDNPDAGTLGMDGEMIDRPHLKQARRLLEIAGKLAQK